ncbi:aminopeptidase, partial [Pantoea allii]
MFYSLRLRVATVLFGALISPLALATPTGQFAEQQVRHIATYFPGRMSGSPAELMAADYLQQQFTALGYKTD